MSLPPAPGLQDMIIVAGHLEVHAHDRDRFVADSAQAVELARATEGCLDFAVSADSVAADRVNVFERWTTREHLTAFRGDGPENVLSARIVAAHIDQFAVTAADDPVVVRERPSPDQVSFGAWVRERR